MDANGDIYRDLEERIPGEDKARLDGYLRGRAEAHERKVAQAAQAAKLSDLLERAEG